MNKRLRSKKVNGFKITPSKSCNVIIVEYDGYKMEICRGYGHFIISIPKHYINARIFYGENKKRMFSYPKNIVDIALDLGVSYE